MLLRLLLLEVVLVQNVNSYKVLQGKYKQNQQM
jgi:hypothetical protein